MLFNIQSQLLFCLLFRDINESYYPSVAFLKSASIYYCHKVKHIAFDITTSVLETVRTETFERYQIFVVVDNKSRIPATLIKKSCGISDLFIGCKHITKITHKFDKIQ